MDNYRTGIDHVALYLYQYPFDGKKKHGQKAGVCGAQKENPCVFTVVPKVLRILIRNLFDRVDDDQ